MWQVFNIIYNYLLYNCEKMQLTDGVCQKHCPLVFLADLLLVKEYAIYVKFHTGSEI
jgi:hypothetical protein